MGAAARMPDAAIDLLRIATVEYNLEDNILHIRSNSGNHYQFQAAYAQDIGHLPKWKIALLMGIKAAHAEGEASRPSNECSMSVSAHKLNGRGAGSAGRPRRASRHVRAGRHHLTLNSEFHPSWIP